MNFPSVSVTEWKRDQKRKPETTQIPTSQKANKLSCKCGSWRKLANFSTSPVIERILCGGYAAVVLMPMPPVEIKQHSLPQHLSGT